MFTISPRKTLVVIFLLLPMLDLFFLREGIFILISLMFLLALFTLYITACLVDNRWLSWKEFCKLSF